MSNEKLPNKFKRITSGLSSLLIGSILLTTVPTKAGSFQLVDMGCRTISPPTTDKQLLRLRAKKVLIGNQEFDEVAVFGSGSFLDSIGKKEPIFIICPIASGNNSRFQSLRLQLGLDSRNDTALPGVMRYTSSD